MAQPETSSGTWRSRTVIVATGGRQADPKARDELSGGAGMPLRGNAYSAGGGMNLAESLGGVLNLENRGFYGHLFAAGLIPVSPVDFIAFALYQGERGILLDPEGHRFAEETLGDHNNATALAAHGGRGLLIWSEQVQSEAAAEPFVAGSPQMDRWQISKDRGGRVGVGSSLQDVAEAASGWGYAVRLALASDPVVRGRLGGGRIYFAEVVPAIAYTFGGVRADTRGAVLNSAAEILGGVYVAGADMSDIYHEGYGGGLCAAVVTGREAGRNAASEALHPAQAD
ncbi:FAD-binding protein [Arthrobacter bambusae]|uniref:FAD-binding protein n=1 Tax=Arthrobacter bambusae TaxID=1338426 RepID=UPI00278A8B80|nr:FAD-binding protein [Arthrobacter bambusae]MDQ0242117.1 succinate dehydrogenase/fumarate reductase flavoprotein subunit [Arthrobacter bambusae]